MSCSWEPLTVIPWIIVVMPIRQRNLITERAGVNYVREVVEANNSVFKEMNQYDYGHDAFVLLVEGEQVLPKEIAMQIKSGASYCTAKTCKIPATAGHLAFWAGHDLVTLGVVYDPAEDVAYWVDLQAEARDRTRRRLQSTGAVVELKKAEWNRLDPHMFAAFLVPTLQHKAPHMSLQTSIAWARSEDLETHDLGVRILSARHCQAPEMWSTLLELFRHRDPARVTPHVWIALVKMIGHHDDDYSYRDAPDELKRSVRQEIFRFGAVEMAKLLFYVDDYGFDRPSSGYSLMAIFGARVTAGRSLQLFETIPQSIRKRETRRRG